MTRYFAGSYLQQSVTTTTGFAGQSFHPAIETYAGPARIAEGSAPVSSTLAGNRSTCDAVARQRATDIAFQGFGEATQKSVFDNSYRDCMTWRANH